MTITPTAPGPVVLPAGAADSGGTADGTAPGDFLALVQQALAGAPGTPQGPAVPGAVTGAATGTPTGTSTGAPTGTPTGTAVDPGASTDTEAGTAPGTAPDAAVAAAIAGLVPVIAPVAVVAPAGTPATAPASGATTTDAVTAPARPATGAPVAPAAPAGETRHDSTRSGGDDAGATALPAAADAAQPGAQPAPSGDSAPPAPATAVTAPAPTTAPAVPLAAAPVASQDATTAPAPVAGQVFPEVTSLVSRGNGTHRITMTLNPEALGEVRVVMTVRDGAVHVRLAAGHDARQALLEGSPELTRLLEHAGATDTRIVVRDLPAGPAPTTGSASADHGPDLGQGPGGGLGAGSNRPHDEHAGTRADTPATDGTHDSTTAGANPPRSIQPVTHTRTAGVDVTM